MMGTLYDFVGNILTASQMSPTPACPQPQSILNTPSIITKSPPLFPFNAALQNAFNTWNSVPGITQSVYFPAAQVAQTLPENPAFHTWTATVPFAGNFINPWFPPPPITNTSIGVKLRIASPEGFANNFQSDTLTINITCFWNGCNAWSGLAVLGATENWPYGQFINNPPPGPNLYQLPAEGGWAVNDLVNWYAQVNPNAPSNPLFSDIPPKLLMIGVNVQALSTGLSPAIWQYGGLILGPVAEAPFIYLGWGVKIIEIDDLTHLQQTILSQSNFFFPSDTKVTYIPGPTAPGPISSQGFVLEYSQFDGIESILGQGAVLLSPYSILPDATPPTASASDIFSSTVPTLSSFPNPLSSYTVSSTVLTNHSTQKPNLIIPNNQPIPLVQVVIPSGFVLSSLAPLLIAPPNFLLGNGGVFYFTPANIPLPEFSGFGILESATSPIYPLLYDIIPNGHYCPYQLQRLPAANGLAALAYQIPNNGFPFFYQTYYVMGVSASGLLIDPSIPELLSNFVGPHIEIPMVGSNNYTLYLQ